MKVLIFCHSYSPVLSPRALRWSAIAEEWAANGAAVDVVSGPYPGAERAETLNGVGVTRCGAGSLEMIGDWCRASGSMEHRTALRLPEPFTKQSQIAHAASRSSAIVIQQARRLWRTVYWPDYACNWYWSALRTGKKMLLCGNYDCVISVSHPFTGHLVAARLHRKLGFKRWLADIGDPFSFLVGTPPNNHALYSGLNYRAERDVLRRATAVAVTTPSAAEKYEAIFPEVEGKLHVIPPVFSLPPRRYGGQQEKSRLRLVFAGTLYSRIRSPRFLLELFSKLLRQDTGGGLELHFYGSIVGCERSFEPYSRLLGSRIFTHGQQSREQIAIALEDADVLVNIGNATTYQLPSKLVEYTCIGRPILNLVCSEHDSSIRFLSNYPAAMSVTNGPVGQREIERVAAFIVAPPMVSGNFLIPWRDRFSIGAVAAAYRQVMANEPISETPLQRRRNGTT